MDEINLSSLRYDAMKIAMELQGHRPFSVIAQTAEKLFEWFAYGHPIEPSPNVEETYMAQVAKKSVDEANLEGLSKYLSPTKAMIADEQANAAKLYDLLQQVNKDSSCNNS